MEFVLEKQRQTPVAGRYGVIVAGGGAAGVGAAIAAAKAGAKTLLVESQGALGGTITVSLMNKYYVSLARGGVTADLFRPLLESGGAIKADDAITTADPEALKLQLETSALEAGVELLYHTQIAGAVVEDNVCKGIIIENKSGRQALLSKVVVDATGDGDVFGPAGAPFEIGRGTDGATVAMTLGARLGNVDLLRMLDAFIEVEEEVRGKLHEWYALEGHSSYDLEVVKKRVRDNQPVQIIDLQENFNTIARRSGKPMTEDEVALFSAPRHPDCLYNTPLPGVVNINLAHVGFVNPLDQKDITRATVTARKEAWAILDFVRKYVPGFEDAYMADTSATMGVREARRIVGEYVLTRQDIIEAKKFDDVVLRTGASIDLHAPDGSETTKIGKKGEYVDIPYRCLVPQKIDNLLVAGRCIATRVDGKPPMGVSNAFLVGQAAGVAAALSARDGVAPRKLDVALLQATLLEQGLNVRGVSEGE